MDSRSTDRTDDPTVAETPEDVAVLYSWANLHGAKYRDFSASRREYRAQLRHRAAEQVREQALLAQAEAEAAAAAAESAARHAAQAARTHQADDADSSMRRALREAEEAARTAAAERVEAARRAEAAAVAEAAARREEREIAEAHASAQRQAARHADSEMRRKAGGDAQHESPDLPGAIADPYTIASTPQTPAPSQPVLRPEPQPLEQAQQAALPRMKRVPTLSPSVANILPSRLRWRLQSAASRQATTDPAVRRAYHPDDASGVRQIYRGPLIRLKPSTPPGSSNRQSNLVEGRAVALSAGSQGSKADSEAPGPHTTFVFQR